MIDKHEQIIKNIENPNIQSHLFFYEYLDNIQGTKI